MTLVLDRPEELTLERYRAVVAGRERIEIEAGAADRVEAGRRLLAKLLDAGTPVYGVNTGLGYLHRTDLDPADQASLQHALLTARAAGLHGAFAEAVVRGVMLLRLNAFLGGEVGVGVALCAFIADRLNDGWCPVVPTGPYGAAGEIGALAHLFQTFTGDGEVTVGGVPVAAAHALADRGLEPLALGPKEGLALINGSPFATVLGLEQTERARALLDAATVCAALTVALTGSSLRPYAARVGELERDPAIRQVHARLGLLLAGLEDSGSEQAPVSFRVVPQVHGAALDQIDAFESRLAQRLGAVTDSPLVLAEADDRPAGVYSSGGFHAAGPALHADALAVAVSQVANLAERRLHRLLDNRFSGLPEQLAAEPGRHAGVISLHKLAVALCAEIRLLAAPVSVHPFDTSSGQEDVQTFTFLQAERLDRSLEALETILACELVGLRQAAHLRARPLAAPALERALERVSAAIPPVLDDRSLAPDVESARAIVSSGAALE